MSLTFGSACSGIEAASVAWKPLGWRCAFMSEIEAFPRAVLAHHYPDVPLHGDFTTIQADDYERIDVLVGGTPCQSFSVAGLRGGLDDDRGNLVLEYLRLADRLRPRWLVWENVPGVLSSAGGRDFGAILGGMVELGYGWAYRVLDAQFFGVAQRRRRVFVVGYAGDWRRAAAVLFERHCLQGHPAPSREAGKSTSGPIAGCSNGGGANGPGRTADDAESLIVEFTEIQAGDWRPSEGTLLTAHEAKSASDLIAFDTAQITSAANRTRVEPGEPTSTLNAKGQVHVAGTIETVYGVNHADAAQTGPDQALRALRSAVGEEAYSEWSLGVVAAFWPPEVLRSAVHGCGVRRAADNGHVMDDDPLPRPKTGARGAVLALWRAGCVGRSPRGWRPSEQLASELVAYLSELPRQGAPAEGFLFSLWRAAEGLGPLREALSALQETWRSKRGEDQPAPMISSAVRRLTPRECERLMGFPDDYTAITSRGKPAADGPRYKALGNSMAVPVMAWLGRRIALVDQEPEPA